jgi:hypothetical protein
MARSTLDRTGEQKPVTDKGHGTEALGPSGNSDSGSDVQGGPGLAHDVEPQRRSGDTSEPEAPRRSRTAGPDVGDANLDSDSDAGGTGERASAGRDTTFEAGSDIVPEGSERTSEDVPDAQGEGERSDRADDVRGHPSRRRRRK